MNKIIVLTNIQPKVANSIQFPQIFEEKSEIAKSVDLMLFWDGIQSHINDYNQYSELLNMIYSINHNFIKCDTNGRKTKEIGK